MFERFTERARRAVGLARVRFARHRQGFPGPPEPSDQTVATFSVSATFRG